MFIDCGAEECQYNVIGNCSDPKVIACYRKSVAEGSSARSAEIEAQWAEDDEND